MNYILTSHVNILHKKVEEVSYSLVDTIIKSKDILKSILNDDDVLTDSDGKVDDT